MRSIRGSRTAPLRAIALIAGIGGVAVVATAADAEERLVLAVDPPAGETNLFWGTHADVTLYPMLLPLVGNDHETGEYDDSGLARDWEHNEDFTEWTFHLHEDAEWHFGFGPVTADDVAHSYELQATEDSVQTGVAQLIGAQTEVVDDHTIRFVFDEPQQGFLFSLALRGSMVVYSLAQYEEEGLDGYRERPAGTGPFRFLERREGDRLSYERVEDHWQGQDAGVAELEFRWAPEPATKLAMLLAGEADIAELPRELQPDAVAEGMEIIRSLNPANHVTVNFNGLYMQSGDEAHNPDLPWADIRVREAMNRALNREEMIDILYEGRAERLVRYGMHPPHEGYVPELEERFDDEYGYDPERASELLDEAGYPESFEDPTIPIISSVLAGNPEFGTMAELLQVYFERVGFQTEIREMDWASLGTLGRGREAYVINPIRNMPIRPSEVHLINSYTPGGSPFHGYEDDTIQSKIDEIRKTFDPEQREQLIGEAFAYLFEQYSDAPVAALHMDVTVNPDTVAGWTFPGVTTGGMSHWHLIEPAS